MTFAQGARTIKWRMTRRYDLRRNALQVRPTLCSLFEMRGSIQLCAPPGWLADAFPLRESPPVHSHHRRDSILLERAEAK